MTDVNDEISQGSSVSSILFLIYIRYSLSDRSDDERIMSYVDDIELVVSSKSIERNCELLQKLAENLLLKQEQNCMQFDTDKIELIHFHSKRKFDLENERHSVKVEKTIFQSKEVVKYLSV